MKKLIQVLIIGLLLICTAACSAVPQGVPDIPVEPSASAKPTREAEPVDTAADGELPAIGETLYGFTVKEHYPLENVDATCVYMVHDKTGAQLTYVACEDIDRAFDITFRTPANDDKGIPHVFEHATLCGSEKYPDPSLFFSMMYQTYNTYLNAATMQSCTTFPAASLSEEQLYVYADYILSGVFDPLIMTDERAMMREAYRYELKDADAEITLNGTVYSEMQGVLTPLSRAGLNLKKLLYPGSISSNLAGGDPAVIPQITHQELKDFHDSYYHPSNSMIVLYGKLDYERFLKLIDEEYLSKYDRREITLSDDAYTPFTGYREQVYAIPATANAATQPMTFYGISLQNAAVQDTVLMEIIATALSVESSPFQKRCREKLPDAITAVMVDNTTADLTLVFMGMNVGEADKDAFKALTDEAIAEVLSDGLDMDVIESQCRKQHYADVITWGQSGTGSDAAMRIGADWGATEDPFAYKKNVDTKRALMTYVENDAFNETFKRLLTDPVRSAMAIAIPEPGGMERQSAALESELTQRKAAMTKEEIDALVAKTADFAAWTNGNQENSMIDTVKAVSAQTLPEEIVRYEAEERTEGGMRVISSEVSLDDVIKVEIGFDASTLTIDQLRDYGILINLMGTMSTKTYDKAQLSDALLDASYDFGISGSTLEYKTGGYRPTFLAYFVTTQDKLEASFELLNEILYETDFSDADLLRRILKEKVTENKMMASITPETIVKAYGLPLISDKGQYTDYIFGDESILYQQAVSEMTDDEINALVKRLTVILETLLNKNEFYVTCVGTAESIERAVAHTSELYTKLDDQKHDSVDYTGLLTRRDTPLASVIDGTVQYNMLIASMKDSGFEENGKMLAMNQLVIDKILFQVLRFENSAYGARASLDGDGVYVYSYRDPNLAKTYAVYENLGDRIRELELTQEDLDGYIAGVYTTLASPMNALEGGSQAAYDVLTGETTFDDYLRWMRELKQFCPEDVSAYAAVYDMLAEKGYKVTVSGAEAIKKNHDMFRTILTTYVE